MSGGFYRKVCAIAVEESLRTVESRLGWLLNLPVVRDRDGSSAFWRSVAFDRSIVSCIERPAAVEQRFSSGFKLGDSVTL